MNNNLSYLLFILPDPPPGLLTPSGFRPTLYPSLQPPPPMAHMHPSHQPHLPQVGHISHFIGHPYGLCSYSPDFMFNLTNMTNCILVGLISFSV